MKPRLLTATVLAALLAACAAPPARAAEPTRIMPLGDSITHGILHDDVGEGGYRIGLEDALVAGGYAFDFVGSRQNGPAELADRQHQGHPGARISDLDREAPPEVTVHRPNVVLLLIGTNDMVVNDTVNDPPSEAPQRLGKLVDKIIAASPGAAVLVASPPPLVDAAADARAAAYTAAIPGVVREKVGQGKRVAFVDLRAAMTTADIGDSFAHPSPAGYAKIAVAGTVCEQAVAVAGRWLRRVRLGRPAEHVGGFACTRRPHSFDQVVVRCRERTAGAEVAFVHRS